VHGDAQAYYNVGYLLNKKGQSRVALQYFALALRADPSLAPARQWFDYLQQQSGQAAHAPQPLNPGVTVGNPATTMPGEAPAVIQQSLRVSQAYPPAPLDAPLPQRLPTTNARWATPTSESDPPGTAFSSGRSASPQPPLTASRPSGDALPEAR
jgi:hypothetical protein